MTAVPIPQLETHTERFERQLTWGRNIRIGRAAARLTQKALAELVGITQATVANYEAGRIAPRDEIKARIATALNSEVPRLFPIEPAELIA